MITLIRLELLAWIRSKRALILFFTFIFSGLIFPLGAAKIKDMLSSLGGIENSEEVIPDPTWDSLIDAYFKNVSQLILLLATFLLGSVCFIGKKNSLPLFYRSRAANNFRLYFPKLIVGLGFIAAAALVGGITAVYTTWVFFPHIPVGRIVVAILVQIVAFLAFCLFGATLSIWGVTPILSAVITMFIVLITSVRVFNKWFFTTLLSPDTILIKGFSWSALQWSWLYLVATVLVCGFLISRKPR